MEQFWQKLTLFAFKRSDTSGESCIKKIDQEDSVITITPETADFLETCAGSKGGNLFLYQTALTHRSVVHDYEHATPAVQSNQRLEFLGDAVLGLLISDYLFRNFPDSREGELSSNRAKIVNRKSLAGFARSIGLGKHLIIGESADKNKIRSSESALADAFESLIGAIYLDKGLDAAFAFVMKQITEHADFRSIVAAEHNYKSQLIEYTQSHHLPPPVYKVIAEEGAEHEKTFTIEVSVDDRQMGQGTAPRKKDAEQLAAREAIDRILTDGHTP
ncbi:ribonuclease III [Chlorobium phaeobacteroides]|jgi:ribonuclease-3|uniref:Ribonuclease 3 n=1 Tax=Chlorobium phaeobacteroides (strain DSM 266 / SMG 266 / 2430) TaxID=290317 RepID=A1BJA6_CHLPD|nr:ribonuclease III [Chlorobium phaeobacteroides]ABL66483.1 RNAse III [Chlorobium phaeobacteroides DSM 266]MBV5319495.1 ribonuclease III [Chlorobium phaeobacteroides]